MKSSDYIEKNKFAYDEMSPVYKSKREKGDFKIYPDIIKFSDLIKNHFLKPRILEIGPGAGMVLKFFSNQGLKTSAIDISSKMIDVAKEESPETEYFLGNFLDYDFKESKFEGIFAKAVFHLFTKKDAIRLVNKSYSLLTRGGLFYLSAFVYKKSKEGFMPKDMEGKKFIRYNRDWENSELDSLINEIPFSLMYLSNNQYNSIHKWSAIFKKY